MGVLEEFESVIDAIKRALEVAEHDVRPVRGVGIGGDAATQIRLVDMDEAGQLARALALGHRLRRLALQAPRRTRMHARMARPPQPGDVGPAVHQHTLGEKPRRRRQTTVLEQRAGHKAGLMKALWHYHSWDIAQVRNQE